MKATILYKFLVCAMGTSIQASMMSEFGSVTEIVQSVFDDMTPWLSEEVEQRGGLNEEDIHNSMRAYLETGWPVTDEMLNSQDYVTRFDANKDGLVDKNEVIKLIRWFVRALYFRSERDAQNLFKDKDYMRRVTDTAFHQDKNADGMLDKDEFWKGIDWLRIELGSQWKPINPHYFDDYDTDSNGLLDQREFQEIYMRYIRDYKSK